jgi:hypothetical protein
MSKYYKIGDRVEQLNEDGEVIDRGTVVRIADSEIWCLFDSDRSNQYYFEEHDNEFRIEQNTNTITVETVRSVLKAYQEYAKVDFMPEYVHQEVHKMMIQRDVKNSQEFKDFMAQYEKFKEYL